MLTSHLAVLLLFLRFLLEVLGPGIVVFLLVVFLGSPDGVEAAAKGEWRLVEALGPFGPQFAWNAAVELCGPTASTPLGACWYPLIVYRGLLFVGVFLAVSPLAWACWRLGRATQMVEMSERMVTPKPHQARGAIYLLFIVSSLPAVFCCLPFNTLTPISAPLIALALVPAAWWCGRTLPFDIGA